MIVGEAEANPGSGQLETGAALTDFGRLGQEARVVEFMCFTGQKLLFFSRRTSARLLTPLAGSIFLLMSCAQVLADSLAGSEWRPTRIGSVLVPANTAIYVQFKGEGRLAGFAGCNHFFGRYKIVEQSVTLFIVDATGMTCPDTIANMEAAFVEALRSAARFEKQRAVLALINRDGTQVAAFAQTDWD
jgi:heat shock protein HslJ